MQKTILITGASSGIGKETAKLFQSKGWNVIATMRRPENETELNQLDHVWVAPMDVLDFESIHTTIEKGIQRFGKIDVLLNNAGYGAYGPLETFTSEKIARQFNTNVIGLLEVTKTIIPHFRKNREGIVINVSSMGGRVTFPFGSLYHGTKFAVEGISEALSFELGEFGGKVKIIEPGMIATDFSGRSFDFSNDESIIEYQGMIAGLFSTMSKFAAQPSPASLVAAIIYEAATDGTDTLRYIAGEDAKQAIASRTQVGDQAYLKATRELFVV